MGALGATLLVWGALPLRWEGLLMGFGAGPALALAVLALGLWLPDVHQPPLDSRRLGVSLTGWLLFVVVLTLTALATAGRRGRE